MYSAKASAANGLRAGMVFVLFIAAKRTMRALKLSDATGGAPDSPAHQLHDSSARPCPSCPDPADRARTRRRRRLILRLCVDAVYTSVHSLCGQEEQMPGPKTGPRETRNSTINLRASVRQRALIDRAAAALGKNRSDFMLDAACREADAVLLDRRLFVLEENAYRRFTEALDRAPADNPRLRRLLKNSAPWER
jgi:uncharacterized protein (DUF1778 family)